MFATDTDETGREIGPAMQYQVPASVHGINIANPIPHGGSASSEAIPSNGWQKIAVGVTSSKGGALSIQRYLDVAGTIPVGAAISTTLVAATANSVTATDGVPFLSFIVTITNTDGSAAATLSDLAVLQQSA